MIENISRPKTLFFGPDAGIPNNPDLPVLIYHKVLEPQIANKAEVFQQHFVRSRWTGIWKNGIYDYHHFHPDAHEALGIARGHAEILLGGKNGESISVEAGDMVVLPAGTGHKRINGSDNLVVIGAYPNGQDVNQTLKALDKSAAAAENIRSVSIPETDPFYGENGPLTEIWNKPSS